MIYLELNEERKCVLMADEMGLNRIYDYDRVNDNVLAPSNNAQVMMIGRLFKTWKQPIYYKYKNNVSKELFCKLSGNCFHSGRLDLRSRGEQCVILNESPSRCC